MMRHVYKSHIQKLGFEFLEYYSGGRNPVYRVTDGIDDFILKMRYKKYGWPIWNENRILQRTTGIPFVAQRHDYFEVKDNLRDIWDNLRSGFEFYWFSTVSILKDFIPGNRLTDFVNDTEMQCRLVDSLRSIHNAGICRIEIRQDQMVQTPEGTVYYIDLGYGSLRDEIDDEKSFLRGVDWDQRCLHKNIFGEKV